MRKISFLLVGVILLFAGVAFAGEAATISDKCPATHTLSDFQKAMEASANHQDWVVTRMVAEGKVIHLQPGTSGTIEQRETIMGGRLQVVRFLYDGNPNGFYGMWTFANCF